MLRDGNVLPCQARSHSGMQAGGYKRVSHIFRSIFKNATRRLILYVAIALLALIGMLLLDPPGIRGNLATEAFGIFITAVVIYEWLELRDNERWRPATEFVSFE